MAFKNNRLVMKIKSGEAKGVGFTIKGKDNNTYKPIDLTQYTVEFEIKNYPYFTVEPIIKKVLTLEQDSTVGWILEQVDDNVGRFIVQITLEDMAKLIPEKEYYLIITLVNGSTRVNISGEGEKSGVFIVCKS